MLILTIRLKKENVDIVVVV